MTTHFSHVPESFVVHQQSKYLELGYGDGKTYQLAFELLRVLSPSAEVRGHGPGQETLQTGLDRDAPMK